MIFGIFYSLCYLYFLLIKQIFILKVFGEDGVLMNEEQLIKQLQNIVSQSEKRIENPVGIMTTEHRDTWGRIYNILIEGECIFNFSVMNIVLNYVFFYR